MPAETTVGEKRDRQLWERSRKTNRNASVQNANSAALGTSR